MLAFGDYEIMLEGSFTPGQFTASLVGPHTVIALSQTATGGLGADLGESFSLAADAARLTLAQDLAHSLSTSMVI